MSGPGQADGPHIVVVGGGLAGISAAVACADAGARVTLVEKRARLGGLTWSFTHDGLHIDNGQHVFLRCCTAYLAFLGRIGSAGDVELPGPPRCHRPTPAGQRLRRAQRRRRPCPP